MPELNKHLRALPYRGGDSSSSTSNASTTGHPCRQLSPHAAAWSRSKSFVLILVAPRDAIDQQPVLVVLARMVHEALVDRFCRKATSCFVATITGRVAVVTVSRSSLQLAVETLLVVVFLVRSYSGLLGL